MQCFVFSLYVQALRCDSNFGDGVYANYDSGGWSTLCSLVLLC